MKTQGTKCRACCKPFKLGTPESGLHTSCRRVVEAAQKYGWTLQQARQWYGYAR